MITDWGPVAASDRAHASMSFRVFTVPPIMWEASSRFGVKTIVFGKISFMRLFKPLSLKSCSPFFAAITGSTTTGISGYSGR